MITTTGEFAVTGARRITDLGAHASHMATTITIGPEIYERMKVKPLVGDVLVVVVQTPATWVPPPGWTENGSLAWRLITSPADLVASWRFTFLEAGGHRLHLVLGAPDRTVGDLPWEIYRGRSDTPEST